MTTTPTSTAADSLPDLERRLLGVKPSRLLNLVLSCAAACCVATASTLAGDGAHVPLVLQDAALVLSTLVAGQHLPVPGE